MRVTILTIIALLLLIMLVSFDKVPTPTAPEAIPQQQLASRPRKLTC